MGKLPFFDLPQVTADLRAMLEFAARDRERFDDVVVLGIGGSSLGPRALYQALPVAKGPRLHFPDNVDPEAFAALLQKLDLTRSKFLVITKSGGTVETLAQLMIVLDRLERCTEIGKARVAQHLVAVTDPEKGLLRKLARECGWQTFAVPSAVGGRFSVLTPVGLLPLAYAGVDVEQLLHGAASMIEPCTQGRIPQNPAYLLGAWLSYQQQRSGRPIHVLFSYREDLVGLCQWFQQLWAESLGKKQLTTGMHVGPTPLVVKGVTDQHSQLQLFAEGPDDKAYLFLTGDFRQDVPIPNLMPEHEELRALGGKTLGALLAAECEGTFRSLLDAGRPLMRLHCQPMSAATLGQLLYVFEVATAFAGGLYQVSAFDQPGVERGKEYARALMGQTVPGFGPLKELDNSATLTFS